MNAKSTISLAVLAATLFAGTANAEPRWPNWYIGLHGGWSMDDSYDSTTAGTTTEVDTDGGYLLGASLGYVPPTELPSLIKPAMSWNTATAPTISKQAAPAK